MSVIPNPVEGDVMIKLINESGYTRLPLNGDWVKMLNEHVDLWVQSLHDAHVIFSEFQIFVYTGRVWQGRASWSKKDGVKWL